MIDWPTSCYDPWRVLYLRFISLAGGFRMIAPQKINQHVVRRNSRSAYSFRHIRLSDQPYTGNALSAFPPDILNPDQYLSAHVRKFHLSPEKLLLLALLQDGISSFQENLGATGQRKKRLFLDAEECIMAQDTGYFFSFVNVCGCLDVEPSYLRRGLMRWKEAMGECRRAVGLAS
jgi:hypothetical protein